MKKQARYRLCQLAKAMDLSVFEATYLQNAVEIAADATKVHPSDFIDALLVSPQLMQEFKQVICACHAEVMRDCALVTEN